MQPNPEYIQEIIQMVNQSPYPSHMSMQLVSMETDRSEVALEVERCHFQPYEMVHGGVIATLIDTATFWAGFLRIPEDAGLVNIDLKLNYLKPVFGGRLVSRGKTLHPGRSISYAEAGVWDENNNMIAHGTSTLKILPGKGLSGKHPKFL